MKRTSAALRAGLLSLALVLALPAAAELPAPAFAAPAAAPSEVWLLPGHAEPTRRVNVTVERPATHDDVPEAFARFPGHALVPLRCLIESRTRYPHTELQLQLLDAGRVLIVSDMLQMTLHQGTNAGTFNLDLRALPPGDYVAQIAVTYSPHDAPARYVQPIKIVSGAQLGGRQERMRIALDDLEARVQRLAPGAGAPYLRMRLQIARDALQRAAALAAQETWREMDYHLDYVEETVADVAAGIVFSGLSPELLAPFTMPDLSQIRIQSGAFFAGNRPVYLFGRELDTASPSEIAALERYGLNLAVLDMPPPPPGAPLPTAGALQQRYDPLFEAARQSNVSVTVQLGPPVPAELQPVGWPRVSYTGFLDLTSTTARARKAEYLQVALPYLTAKPMLHAVSLANEPKFMFRGEEVRQRFLEWAMARYEDRHDLNQAWRSHLRDFEDIQLWATLRHPEQEPLADPLHEERRPRGRRGRGQLAHYDRESQYQERRAYQYDWQMFHRGLSTEYFAWLASVARRAAPQAPLMVAAPGTVFQPGESRFGVEREPLARIFDINATIIDVNPADPVFAYSYPRQSAVYSLLRTLAPDKPVFNLGDSFDFSLVERPAFYRSYLHAALWEAVMSGMNATALAPDSGVLEDPRALEGLATANLDINRLGEQVHAFQRAPLDIGILFSESSKIFDDGLPHLQSAIFAYEGCSFAGYHVGFITEAQVIAGALDHIRILVLPDTPAVSDSTFERLQEFVEGGGTVARPGTPIPYNEHGHSRTAVLRNTERTVLVRGLNLPTEYLHAMDAAIVLGVLPPIPRPINAHGYPLEGVRTRFLEIGGVPYLYLVNLRKEPVVSHLTGNVRHGRDLVRGRDVSFPMPLAPLDPMLIRLDRSVHETTVVAGAPRG